MPLRSMRVKATPGISHGVDIRLCASIERQQSNVATVVRQGLGCFCVAPPLAIHQSEEYVCVAGTKGYG